VAERVTRYLVGLVLVGLVVVACAPASERARFEEPPVVVEQPPAASIPAPTTTTTPLPPGVWTTVDEPGAGGRITGLAIDPFDSDRILVGGDLIGAGLSTDGGATWQSTFGLTNAEMASFTFHPTRKGEVWVGTMGGPFLSTDGGLHWEARRTGMPPILDIGYSAPIEEVLVDPGAPDRLLAFGGSHREWDAPGTSGWGVVWESLDAGASWSAISVVADGTNVVDATRLADGTLLVAALGRGLYRSTDGGRTWGASSQGLPHGGVRALAAHPTDPSTVWVALGASGGSGGGVWRSGDGGRSWVPSNNGLDTNPTLGSSPDHMARYYTLAVAPTDPTVLLTANLAYGAEAVYRSNDGGDTWIQVVGQRGFNGPSTAYTTPATANALAIDPRDADRMLVGNSEFVLGSEDGGDRWRDLTSDVHTDGTTSGRGFSGLVANRAVFSPDGGELVLCGFDGANPLLSTDGGTRWERPLVPSDPWGGCLDAAYSTTTPNRRYVLLGQNGTFGGVAVLEPNANQFRVAEGDDVGLPDRYDSVGNEGALEVVAMPGGGEHVVASIGGDLYVSGDGGGTFARTVSGLSVEDLAADPTTPGRVYLAAAGGVYRSDDGGSSAVSLAGSPAGAVRLFDDPQSGRLYATVWRTAGAGLWRMDPTGTWLRLTAEPTTFDVAVDPRNPHHLIVVTNDHPYHDRISSIGVVESYDDGVSFAPLNDGLPLLRVATVAIDPADPARVVIGTFGRGFFETEIPA
jgi:hypothetical protein